MAPPGVVLEYYVMYTVYADPVNLQAEPQFEHLHNRQWGAQTGMFPL